MDLEKILKKKISRRKALTTAGLIGLFLLPAVISYTLMPPSRYEDIDLSSYETLSGNPRYEKLEDALNHTPKKQGDTVRINAYDGIWELEGGARQTFDLRDQVIVGYSGMDFSQIMDEGFGIYDVNTSEHPVFTNGIRLYGGSGVEGVVKKGTLGFYAEEGNTYVRNNLMDTFSWGVIVKPELQEDVVIEENTFKGKMRGSAIIAGGNVTNQIRIKKNVIKEYKNGVMTEDVANIFLGDSKERGDNSFVKNDVNLYVDKNTSAIPAEYNFWTDKEGNVLTSETDIVKTVKEKVKPSAMKSLEEGEEELVDVKPFLVTLPFIKTAFAHSWEAYR